MPFQSEKQRRYLWANEPEIARDWTDTYGSGIAKALGGRIGMATGMSPGAAQARGLGAQHHGSTKSWGATQQNVGPTGGEGFVPGMGTVSASGKVTPITPDVRAPDFVTQPWKRGFKSISPNLSNQSSWQKFLGKMRGWNDEEDRPYTQDEWEANKAQRIADKRIQNITSRDIPWTADTLDTLRGLGYQGNLSSSQIDTTPFERYPPRVGTPMEDYAKGIASIDQPMYDEMTGNVALSKRYPAGFSDEMTDDVALSKLRAGSDIDVMKGSVIDKKPFNWSSLNPLNLIFGTPAEAGMNQEQVDYLNRIKREGIGSSGYSTFTKSERHPDQMAGAFFEYADPTDVWTDIESLNPKSTNMFSSAVNPEKIVYGDKTTFAQPDEVTRYIHSLSPKDKTYFYGLRKNVPGVDYTKPTWAEGGRIGYHTGGLATLWPR
jgi:hypothetical protein